MFSIYLALCLLQHPCNFLQSGLPLEYESEELEEIEDEEEFDQNNMIVIPEEKDEDDDIER